MRHLDALRMSSLMAGALFIGFGRPGLGFVLLCIWMVLGLYTILR